MTLLNLLLLSGSLSGAAPAPLSTSALERPTWVLTGMTTKGHLRPVSAAAAPTLNWQGTKVSGQGGCNLYTGQARLSGPRLQITKLSTTRRACEPQRMQLENDFLKLLGTATHAQLSGQTLTLFAGKTSRLVFRAQSGGQVTPAPSPSPAPSATFSGKWTPVTLQASGQAIPLPAATTLNLSVANGTTFQLSGKLDCNELQAEATLNGQTLTFGPLAGTRMLCENMQAESALTQLLRQPVQVTVQGDQMTWQNSAGRLVLKRTAQATTPTPSIVTATQLTGGTFTLLSVGGKAPKTAEPLTLSFTGGRLGGYDGCNHFGGKYGVGKGGELLLTGPLTSTLVGCTAEMPDLTRLLSQQPRLTLSGKTLTLESGGVNWVFERR